MTLCRSHIDIAALHQAFQDEGFRVIRTAPEHVNYQRVAEDGAFLNAIVPRVPVDDSDLYDTLEALHEDAAECLRFLWRETGNAHCEVGSLVLDA